MRYLIGPVGQPIRQMTDRRTVMYTGKGACCFALLSRGAANRISADEVYHSVQFWSGRDRKRHEETTPAGGGGIFAPLKLPDKSSAS